MCCNSTRYFADSNTVGIKVRASCQITCIKSVLEVNTDARSSAFLFRLLVAEDCFSSAFPSGGCVIGTGPLVCEQSLMAEMPSPPGNGS